MKIKRLLKNFGKGEKGFTLLELLIVVVILGVLAAVIVPNLAAFLSTGNIAAANTEVANVETAALAYYADNNGDWPDDSDTLSTNKEYLDGDSIYRGGKTGLLDIGYEFDDFGKVTITASNVKWPTDPLVEWNETAHKWEKV